MRFSNLVVASSIVVTLLGCSENAGQRGVSTSCEKMFAIGRDPVKVDVLRIWIDENRDTKNFLEIFDRTRTISAIDNTLRFSQVDFDWESVGFDRDLAYIFIGIDSDDRKKILSAGFGEGRNGIFIEVDGKNLITNLGERTDTLKIEEGVYVVCREETLYEGVYADR